MRVHMGKKMSPNVFKIIVISMKHKMTLNFFGNNFKTFCRFMLVSMNQKCLHELENISKSFLNKFQKPIQVHVNLYEVENVLKSL